MAVLRVFGSVNTTVRLHCVSNNLEQCAMLNLALNGCTIAAVGAASKMLLCLHYGATHLHAARGQGLELVLALNGCRTSSVPGGSGDSEGCCPSCDVAGEGVGCVLVSVSISTGCIDGVQLQYCN
jgi:hypothetical protein